MNDFTKEELTYLYETVYDNCECYREPEIAYTLRDKLKNMMEQDERRLNVITKICCGIEWDYFEIDKGIAFCPICKRNL